MEMVSGPFLPRLPGPDKGLQNIFANGRWAPWWWAVLRGGPSGRDATACERYVRCRMAVLSRGIADAAFQDRRFGTEMPDTFCWSLLKRAPF